MFAHVFSGNPLDRGDRERRDEEWIRSRAQDPASRFLPMRDLNVLVSEDAEPRLGWLGVDDLNGAGADSAPVFLGLLDGVAHFAIDVSRDGGNATGIESSGRWKFQDCRAAGQLLPGPDAGVVAQARAQLDWHARHQFCSVCGHKTASGRGGHVRVCPQCNAQHFPRTDPVVIAVVVDTESDRCLLGQSRGRLSRMQTYSALAGFMDQGESIEEAVAREVMEEAGIEVKVVRVHSSQPWPFPSSLMIGCIAEAATTNISMDDVEMADVQWFDRDEVVLALEGKSEALKVPGPIAIAHHLIKAWAMRE